MQNFKKKEEREGEGGRRRKEKTVKELHTKEKKLKGGEDGSGRSER